MKRFLLPVAIAAAAAAVAAVQPVLATTAFVNFYHPLAQGYDIGWPQCSGSSYSPGPSGGFGIVGIDHGRPFDPDNQYGPNLCLQQEYAAAQASGNAALYMNTGYATVYYTNHSVPQCTSQMGGISGGSAMQQAWEIGCATAYWNWQYATGTTVNAGGYQEQGLTPPTMWWLDVETGNSWASGKLYLNAETLTGAVQELRALTPSIPVGIYSTSYQWGKIVGKYSSKVAAVDADWVASGSSTPPNTGRYCGTGFSGAPVWLVQWTSTFDYDVPC